MAWVEGLTSSNRLLLDLAKILTQANKDASGNVIPEKNWEIVYPRPYDIIDVVGEAVTPDSSDPRVYLLSHFPVVDFLGVFVYETISGVTTVVPEDEYTVDYLTGTITFSAPRAGDITVDYSYKINESLDTAFSKIGSYGRIVLKTTTTPVTPPSGTSDPFNTDPDLHVTELTMYLEIEKPRYLINPETGQMAATYKGVTPIENHYHVNMRIFDSYDYVTEQPTPRIVDPATNEVIQEGAHVSEWAKYAWYKDFAEFLVDELDDDPGNLNINDGIVFTHVETPGVYGELPIQFWISANNDRIAMVLMGEPTINYDNYLVSFAYVGKIESFEGSRNDTAGNFALTCGSSTIPCFVKPNTNPITEAPVWTARAIQPNRGSGTYGSFKHKVSFKVVPYNSTGIGNPSPEKIVEYTYSWAYGSGNETTQYDNFEIEFTSIPTNATGVRIYRKDIAVNPSSEQDTIWFLIADVPRATALAGPISGGSSQDLTKPVPLFNYNPDEAGVVRDPITGAVLQVRFPTTWGHNTATGVNDIAMYKTRSGVYYQRHQVSFITPDPFMKKDAFNPSRWTGKFHLSPLYVVHGYDGYRGWLKDVVVVDDSSIVHLDELIVNKGTANEEVYKFFKLTAPFSFMQTSANANYGIGIKKV